MTGKKKARRNAPAFQAFFSRHGAKRLTFKRCLLAFLRAQFAFLLHAFSFMEEAFSSGQEMVVFVTELTITPQIAAFLSEHRIERFEKYKSELLIGTKRAQLLSQIERD